MPNADAAPDLPAAAYRALVEDAQDVLALVGPDARFRYVSPSVRQVMGYRPEDLTGKDATEWVHPDDREGVLARLSALVAWPGSPARMECRVRHADGSWRTLETWGRNRLDDPAVRAVVVHALDVTERRAVAEGLRVNEARYRTVVHALPDVVSRIRTDGHILDFHVPSVFETDFPASAMIGRRLQDVVPGELAEKFEDGVARMRESGGPVSYGYDVRVGEAVKHREVRLAPIDGDEMISMLRDVTALREHEAALERSESALRALAAHLQNVREEERARLSREVHDVLGQQLTAIKMEVAGVERRLDRLAGGDAEAVREATERITSAKALVDQAVQAVRRIATDLRPGVLDDLGLPAALEWFASVFEARTGVPCRFEDRTDDAPLDRGLATALFRVYQELLTNVARHAEATAVDARLERAGGTVRLVVRDDGRGFDPLVLQTGQTLGVLGMRERVLPYGGRVDYAGSPGGGTTVTVTVSEPALGEAPPPGLAAPTTPATPPP